MQSQRTPDDDRGFTLVEVVVAMAVFAVAASVTLGILINTAGVTRSNINRTTGANLAAKQIESVRTMAATAIPNGTTTTTETVRDTVFTITQTAKFISSGSTNSVCDGSGTSLAYKLVTVKITWPGMGSVKPVRVDTLKSVSVGTGGLDSNLGSLAIKVASAAGAVQSGVAVTVTSGSTSQSGTTGDDGCVVFFDLAVGTYVATASGTGFVGTANTATASVGSLGVTAGGLTRGTLYYDTAKTIAVTFDSPVGAVVPATLPLRIGGTYVTTEYTVPRPCPGVVVAACATAAPGTIQSLFPDNYTVKAGGCTETSASSATIDLRTTTSATPSVVLPVAVVTITVRTRPSASTPVVGRTVTITHTSPATGCTSADTFTISSEAAGTTLVLPYGAWTITTTQSGSTAGTTLSIPLVLSSTNKTATAALVVRS